MIVFTEFNYTHVYAYVYVRHCGVRNFLQKYFSFLPLLQNSTKSVAPLNKIRCAPFSPFIRHARARYILKALYAITTIAPQSARKSIFHLMQCPIKLAQR